jgi:hypothetical protein
MRYRGIAGVALTVLVAACGSAPSNDAVGTAPTNTSVTNSADPTLSGNGAAPAARNGAAQAGRRFTFYNNTGRTITAIEASPEGAGRWTADLLVAQSLAPAARVELTVPETSCSWDIRVFYADGGGLDMIGLDICESGYIGFGAD